MAGSLSCRRRASARDKVAAVAYDSRVDSERGDGPADERGRSMSESTDAVQQLRCRSGLQESTNPFLSVLLYVE